MTNVMIQALINQLQAKGFTAVANGDKIEVQDPVMVLGHGGAANRIEYQTVLLKADCLAVFRFIDARS